jgi:hypothetical protein
MRILTALLFTVSALQAFQPKPALDCNHTGGSRNRAYFCEMREQTVPGSGMIFVDASQNGGVSIKGWDRGDVLVRAQVSASAPIDAQARDLARQVNVQANGPQVRAFGPPQDQDRNWSVTYEIFVPARYSANIEAVNGGVSLSGVTGNLEFKTVNGGLSLHRVGGNVHGRTTNGGVSIELAGDRWDGQGLDVTTVNGGVSLRVPRNYSAQLETQTTNGKVSAPDLARDLALVKTNHIATALGAGGATIRIVTTNGGISLTAI